MRLAIRGDLTTIINHARHDLGKAVVPGLTINYDPLAGVLHNVYADAWVAGQRIAADMVGERVGGTSQMAVYANAIDWSKWAPGDADAALAAADGGLRALLDASDVTIKNIGQATIDRIGNAISNGLANGDSNGTISSAINDLIDNPDRADLIAATETARAMNESQADQYQTLGFPQFDWIAYDGACEICQDAEDASPHDWSDDKPPAHPNCRCGIVGVGDTSQDDSGDA